MRLVLVIVAVAALIATIVFVLQTEPATVPPAVEPTHAASATPSPPSPATATPSRSVERVESRVESVDIASVAAPMSVGSALEITVISSQSGELLTGADVVCTDELGRRIPIESPGRGAWFAHDLAAGEYLVTAKDRGHRPALEIVLVTVEPREQRVVLRLDPAPRVRVFWRTEDDRPFVLALRESGEFEDGVVVQVALDSEPRTIGDAAPTSRQGTTFSTNKDAVGSLLQYGPWQGSPPDALSELELEHEPPAWVCVSANGSVAAVARLDASDLRDGGNSAHEVVLRTALHSLQPLRSAVKFCLVDGQTGAPVTDAWVTALPVRKGPLERWFLGPNGCSERSLGTSGRYLLQFHIAGRSALELEVRLLPDTTLDLGDLRVDAPSKVVVRVSLEDGNPAADVAVTLSSVEGARWWPVARLSTDVEGLAAFETVGQEPCFVRLDDPKFAKCARRVDFAATQEPLFVELRAEIGVSIALDYGPQLTRNDPGLVHDSEGCLVSTFQVPLNGRMPLRLLPGDYVIEIEGRGDPRTITVDGESAVYDLR